MIERLTSFPERIVCLTEETTETLYLLGEDRRIVGISGFTVRPPRARREKPRVSAFTSAKIDRIRALEPDLVLGFSDLQADIAAELARAGIEVHLFNHPSIAEILRMIRMLGPAGAKRRRPRARRYPGAPVQPSHHRRDPAHDPDARRHDRLRGEGCR